jgi:thymidylate synthase (FAD)
MSRYLNLDNFERLSAIDTLRTQPLICLDDGIGCIELQQWMGSDEMVLHAARVSFAAEKEQADAERMAGLIRFMMDNKHGSVFEHNAVTFLVKAPLFVIREWHRHRTQSYNEWSGRYSKLEPEFYIPTNIRHQVGKPGAYTFDNIDNPVMTAHTREVMWQQGRTAYRHYENMLEAGVAKEQARIILPVNTYSKFYATANLRNWMKFLELRNSKHAMYEIRQYAEAIEESLHVLFPVTMAAFRRTGVAP